MVTKMLSCTIDYRIRGFGGLGRSLKQVAPLLAAPAALLLGQGQADAALTFNIFESGGSVVVQASGSLSLPQVLGEGSCNPPNFFISGPASICTGPQNPVNVYGISGTPSLPGIANFSSASSSGGIASGLIGSQGILGIDKNYISGSQISSFASYQGQTLAGLGFTTTGLIGAWNLQPAGTSDPYTAFDAIYACIGADPCAPASVPGPLPLLGAGAAFGWSRRLRKRIATPLSTKTQA